MAEHPIQGLMGTTMQKIREMVDVNTIIGDPITLADGVTIIPVSKVGFGFAAGGSDFPSQSKDLFGGGTGAGISIQPLAFLVVNKGEVKILNMESSESTGDKVVTMVPEVISMVSDLFSKDKKNKDGNETKSDSEPVVETKSEVVDAT